MPRKNYPGDSTDGNKNRQNPQYDGACPPTKSGGHRNPPTDPRIRTGPHQHCKSEQDGGPNERDRALRRVVLNLRAHRSHRRRLLQPLARLLSQIAPDHRCQRKRREHNTRATASTTRPRTDDQQQRCKRHQHHSTVNEQGMRRNPGEISQHTETIPPNPGNPLSTKPELTGVRARGSRRAHSPVP